jgi:type IV pilus assembly protein PilW
MQRSNKICFNRKQSTGFSLVEIMVSLVISLFILGGAVTILMQNQQNYRQNDDFGRLQENARFAVELINSDLRMTGFWGCSNKLTNQVAGVAAGSGELLDTTFALDGFEENSGGWAALDNDEIVGEILDDTDAITVRKLRNAGVPIAAGLGSAGEAITLHDDSSPVQKGELAAIYNCDQTDIFRVTGASATTLEHSAGDNIDNRFTLAYPQNDAHTAADPDGMTAQTFVAAFDAVRYYVSDPDGDNIPTLWRQFHNGDTVVEQPVVEGVESMQIRYGENTAATGEPNEFVNADEIDNWNRVVAVQITLLLRSVEESPTQEEDTKTYDIKGTPGDTGDDVAPGGRYSRKLVSTTVMLRNQQTKIEAPQI